MCRCGLLRRRAQAWARRRRVVPAAARPPQAGLRQGQRAVGLQRRGRTTCMHTNTRAQTHTHTTAIDAVGAHAAYTQCLGVRVRTNARIRTMSGTFELGGASARLHTSNPNYYRMP